MSLSAKSPNRATSAGSAPITMLMSVRPPDIRWWVDAICAARVGLSRPGRNAIRYFRLRVWGSSAAVEIHESSHPVPHGVSTAPNPSWSHAMATCER